jgi:predicted AlkP superfamily phosphohydrolase/phosphomutase
MPEDCNEYARRDAYGDLRRDLLESIRRKTEFVEATLASRSWDLFTVVFSESHCAGHQFWALHDRSHPWHDPERARTLGDPLVEIYTALDDAVGRIVATAGPDALVLLVLSHGMGPHYDATAFLPEMLRRAEVVDIGANRLVASRERIRRAVRRFGRGLDHQNGFIKAVDGSHSCFAVPNNDACGALRINLVGREPRGRVDPGRDLDATCRRIESALAEWRNVDTDAPVVRAVVRTDAHYSGPARTHLPDLLVEWDRSAPIRSVESPRYGRIDREYKGVRSGDHRPGGLLVAAGEGVPTALDPIAAVDLAPTVCAVLGVAAAEDPDGRAVLPKRWSEERDP